MTASAIVMVVNPSLPAKTGPEFIAGGGTVSKKVCRSYWDFLAAFRATSLKSASSLCEVPSGLSKLISVWSTAALPAVSLMAPLALSGAPFTYWRSIVHSFAEITHEHNSGDGPRFLR